MSRAIITQADIDAGHPGGWTRQIVTADDVTHGPGHDRLHLWFEMSYAQYLTVPRSALQSMPDRWQGRMAALLEELDERIDWRPAVGCYYVSLAHDEPVYDERGRVRDEVCITLHDQLADYERGRRRLPLKPVTPLADRIRGRVAYWLFLLARPRFWLTKGAWNR